MTQHISKERAEKIPPDFDEVVEWEKDLKKYPEHESFGAPAILDDNNKLTNLYEYFIDPINPPRRIIGPAKEKKKRKIIPKFIRQYVINRCNNICESCQSHKVQQIHHIDENPSNNENYNLMGVCYDCHHKYHRGVRNVNWDDRFINTQRYERVMVKKENEGLT